MQEISAGVRSAAVADERSNQPQACFLIGCQDRFSETSAAIPPFSPGALKLMARGLMD